MANYTVIGVKSSLHETTSEQSGIVLHRVKTVEKQYKEKLGKTGGMRMAHLAKLFNILSTIVKSNLDMQLVEFLITNNSKKGVVSVNSKPIGSSDLADKFNVSRKKINDFTSRAIESGLLKKDKRKLVLNPYIVIPYNISNDSVYILQVWWDSNFTYDITEELAKAEEVYISSVAASKPSEEV